MVFSVIKSYSSLPLQKNFLWQLYTFLKHVILKSVAQLQGVNGNEKNKLNGRDLSLPVAAFCGKFSLLPYRCDYCFYSLRSAEI